MYLRLLFQYFHKVKWLLEYWLQQDHEEKETWVVMLLSTYHFTTWWICCRVEEFIKEGMHDKINYPGSFQGSNWWVPKVISRNI